jgi:hypothetical protein
VTTRRTVNASDTMLVSEGISVREFDREWVILDLQRGAYFGMNEVGATIWQAISAGKSPAETAKSLGAIYECSETTALQDVLEFVGELIQRGLLEIKE